MKYLLVVRKYFAQTVTNLLLSSAEYTKNCDILMTITLEVNITTRQMTHFFHVFQNLQNVISWGLHFASYSGL